MTVYPPSACSIEEGGEKDSVLSYSAFVLFIRCSTLDVRCWTFISFRISAPNLKPETKKTMPLSFNTKLTVPEDVLLKEIRGESVLLNLDKEAYFGLDKVGTRMWTALSESESIRTAYALLLDRYDVEAELLRRDLFDLVQTLVDHGLLQINDG